MALPYLLAYADPKIQQAYELYLGGMAQRDAATKTGCPYRTLARHCSQDGWEAERKARGIAKDTPHVAALAAAEPSSAATMAALAATVEDEPVDEHYGGMPASMVRILRRQQRLTGMLLQAVEAEVEREFSLAKTAGKPVRFGQIMRLSMLTNLVTAMERKAHCVPDKLEVKDTSTPAQKHIDTVRQLAKAEGVNLGAQKPEQSH
jgi:hypothetical protein